MLRKGWWLFILSFPLLVIANDNANFATLQAEITQAITKKMAIQSHERIEIKVNKMDSRMKLMPCDSKPLITLNENLRTSAHLLVEVNCKHEDMPVWKVYVTASVKIYTPMVIASENIMKNTKLSEKNLQLEEKNRLLTTRGYFKNIADIRGWVANKTIAAGSAISPEQIKPPVVIRKGDLVAIKAGNAAFQIEVRGIAKQDGGLDEPIAVLNQSSGQVITAQVIGKGEVQVDL